MTVRKMYNLNYSIITKLQHYKTIKKHYSSYTYSQNPNKCVYSLMTDLTGIYGITCYLSVLIFRVVTMPYKTYLDQRNYIYRIHYFQIHHFFTSNMHKNGVTRWSVGSCVLSDTWELRVIYEFTYPLGIITSWGELELNFKVTQPIHNRYSIHNTHTKPFFMIYNKQKIN